MEDSATAWVTQQAKKLGFDLCGIVSVRKFSELAPELARTEDWLAQGYAGEMRYLSDVRRRNPPSVLPDLRSVIVCALNYNTDKPRSTQALARLEKEESEPRGWISRYAWGHDYHDVLREKLEELVAILREHFGDTVSTRIYVDTGPVQERIFAKYAGLGWLGKNTLLLNQRLGSYFFLGVVLTTLDLEPTFAAGEMPAPDLCGNCRRCIDACPTAALVEPYVMDARKCISYLTIELKGSIPEELREPMGQHVFGCDICQDVCPWNRRAPITTIQYFQPRSFSVTANVASDSQTPSDTLDASANRETDCEKNPFRANSLASGTAGCTEFLTSGSHTQARVPVLSDFFRNGEGQQEREESLFLPRLEWLATMDEERFRDYFRGSPLKRPKWHGLVRNACIALGNSPIRRSTQKHNRICELLKRLSQSVHPHIAESALWALSRIQ